jgi:hypothetical protein
MKTGQWIISRKIMFVVNNLLHPGFLLGLFFDLR